jgi:hypothetical protein
MRALVQWPAESHRCVDVLVREEPDDDEDEDDGNEADDDDDADDNADGYSE